MYFMFKKHEVLFPSSAPWKGLETGTNKTEHPKNPEDGV